MNRLPGNLINLYIGLVLTTIAWGTATRPASADSSAFPVSMEIATYEQAATLLLYQRFIKESYLRLGITTWYHILPPLRAAISANRGELDALLMASTEAETGADHLLRIPEPLPGMKFRVVTRSDLPVDTLPPDLGQYRVGYLRGIHPLEQLFADKPQKLTTNSGFQTLIELLKLDRVDLIALPELDALLMIRQHDGLRLLQTPVYTFNVYHYVHRGHEPLRDELTTVFKSLKRNRGCMNRIFQSVMGDSNDTLPATMIAEVNAPDYVALCSGSVD